MKTSSHQVELPVVARHMLATIQNSQQGGAGKQQDDGLQMA